MRGAFSAYAMSFTHTHSQLAHACLLTYSLTIIHTQANALIVYVFIHLKLSHITYSLSCIAYRKPTFVSALKPTYHNNFFVFLLLLLLVVVAAVAAVVLMPFCCLYSKSTRANSYRSLKTVSSDTDTRNLK